MPQQSTTVVSSSVVRDRQIPNGYRLTCHNRCLFICCDQAIATYRGGVNVPQQLSLNLANLVNPAPASIDRMKRATMPRNVCLILLNLVNPVNPAQSCKSCLILLMFCEERGWKPRLPGALEERGCKPRLPGAPEERGWKPRLPGAPEERGWKPRLPGAPEERGWKPRLPGATLRPRLPGAL